MIFPGTPWVGGGTHPTKSKQEDPPENPDASYHRWARSHDIPELDTILTEVLRTQEMVRGNGNIGTKHLEIAMEVGQLSLATKSYRSLENTIERLDQSFIAAKEVYKSVKEKIEKLEFYTGITYRDGYLFHGRHGSPVMETSIAQDDTIPHPQDCPAADPTVQSEPEPQNHTRNLGDYDGFPYDVCATQ